MDDGPHLDALGSPVSPAEGEGVPRPPDAPEAPEVGSQGPSRPDSPVELRTAGAVTGVSFPQRTIELVVIPYEEEALVPHRGRMIREVIARGAFDGIERRANRVRVNYQHDWTELRHVLGKALAFYPSRQEGLVARLKIVRGDDGDMALHRADEGVLDASAGFAVMPGGESWPQRELRRLTRLFLDHVALTPEPAYQGATVLAVRSQEEPPPPASATPNLDQVRAWGLADRFTRCG